MIDNNSVFYFLDALQDVFALIRCKPISTYNINILSIFERYLEKIDKINHKELARLKNDITKVENIDLDVIN